MVKYKEYFESLCDLVCIENEAIEYSQLLQSLYNQPFTEDNVVLIDNDINRIIDAMELRKSYYDRLDMPCTLLEVMVALALRCEVEVADDPIYGDRTSHWFWEMIRSLGLSDMDDLNYDDFKVSGVLYDLLNRRYESNGEGGLFTIPNCTIDLRNVEIWYQMLWYMDTILDLHI